MSTRAAEQFTTVRTEGGLLPPGLLARVAAGDATLPGLTPGAYHLTPGEKFGEVINRSWLRLVGAWTGFRDALASTKSGDPATGLTRERWLLVLFAELGYGRLPPAQAVELDGLTFPVSHAWGPSPIHLVGAGLEMDRRTPGVAGAARSSPHSLVQELLNRDPAQLWGFVSNGLRLRILRDNMSLTRQAFIEFDVEAMMDAEIYSDFVVLWLLAHQSRVESAAPADCWLERWSIEARSQGTRALDHLRDSVEEAIVALGRGFLDHRSNADLVAALRDGTLSPLDYYRQLLRIVYRLLFLLVSEERDLLQSDADARVRQRYLDYYSIRHLRELAERRRGTAHTDLWAQIRTVVAFLGSTEGCPALGLPALGSFLFSDEATAALNDCQIANADLLSALRALSGRSDAGYRQRHDYRNLGVEELGSVYESLLELHPEVNVNPASFKLVHGGTERRTTGSHYTPPAILKEVLDFALEPAITRALESDDPTAALLDLRILDPAAGSGHFLIAAAHRVARVLASARTGELEATPDEVRRALRDVVARCVYGTDLNPMAVELCRVALWLETLEPGKPLSFLDHHIRVGNSLLGVPLGTTVARNRAAVDSRRLELEQRVVEVQAKIGRLGHLDAATAEQVRELASLRRELRDCEYDSWTESIPDAAFRAGTGEDRAVARKATAENRNARRSGQLLLAPMLVELPPDLVEVFRQLGAGAEDSVAEVTIRASEFEGVQRREEYRNLVALADTWTAAFFWPLIPGAAPAPTQAWFATLTTNPHALPQDMITTIESLTAERRFFHPEVAWPEVFTSDRGGFDVVMGNPPYLGGNEITVRYGQRVNFFLKVNHPAQTSRGQIDLSAYFLRRCFDALREGGEVCLITTDTIAEGDTRSAALSPIISDWGGEIVNAVRSQPWIGAANVTVAIVHLHKGHWQGPHSLDGGPVDQISTSLTPNVNRGEPNILERNRDLVSVGTTVWGDGFILDADEASRLLVEEAESVAIIKPFIGTLHATSTPDPFIPDRYVIDFGDRTLDEAGAFTQAMSIVEGRVKPERAHNRQRGARENWWKFWSPSRALYERIARSRLTSVIGIPEVSKTMLPIRLPANAVFQHSLFIFTSDDDQLYGELTSSFHWLWAAERCVSRGTTRARYSPTYFLTFPRPPKADPIAKAALCLEGARNSVCRDRGIGLTSVYNLIWNSAEHSSDIAELRGHHELLDRAVSAAYKWSDLDVTPEFNSTRFGIRWVPAPDVQREIERRLLELNHQRARTDSPFAKAGGRDEQERIARGEGDRIVSRSGARDGDADD